MILAMFEREDGLVQALERFRAARLGPLETYTPAPLESEGTASPIPAIIFAAGLLAAAASLALQSYSSVIAYPFQIGGRPQFAWASFVPTVFENAVLIAIVAGFVAFMILNGLPRLYDPVDEWDAMRRASRDRWFLQIATEDASVLEQSRLLLRELSPVSVQELPG